MRARVTKNVSVDTESGYRVTLLVGEGGSVIQQCGDTLTFIPDRSFPWTNGVKTCMHCLVGRAHLQLMVTTLSGREIPAPPALPADAGERAARSWVRNVAKWLIEQSIAEARARDDEYNLGMFQGERADNLPPASSDAMNVYLFGEEHPQWQIAAPPVPKPRLVVSGQVFTRSGRKIAAPPNIHLRDARRTRANLDTLDRWLIEQARAEASALGRQLDIDAVTPKTMSPSQRNELSRYLFGDAFPEWEVQKA